MQHQLLLSQAGAVGGVHSGGDEEVDHVVEVTPGVPVFEIKHQTREELDGIYHKSYS